MKVIVLIIAVISFFSCNEKEKKSALKKLVDLPKQLEEISGIAYSDNLIYAIEDSGNENQITVLNAAGSITKVITVNDVNNIDWEDLTFDIKGNLYIGDFGNNNNVRKDLAIYKIDKSNLHKDNVDIAYAIFFDYPEQIQFPPQKKDLLFDVEAFFEYENYFYLFTKNRSKDFDGSSYVYKVPNTAGRHRAQLIKTITTCDNYDNCALTSAAISPDGKKYVLLSHSKIWLFENFSNENITDGTSTILDLNHFTQKEAICFKSNDTLFIADERVKKVGGHLYQIAIPSLEKEIIQSE